VAAASSAGTISRWSGAESALTGLWVSVEIKKSQNVNQYLI